MTKLWSGVLALALLSGATARAQDPWEGRPLTEQDQKACRALPRALVRPVSPAHRAEAARLLASASDVVVPDSEAAAWIGVDAPKGGVLADRLVKDALNDLEVRWTESWGEHGAKWTLSEAHAVEVLRAVSAEPHAPFKPVLVRAVAGQDPGTFDAADCGGVLTIRHLSRGAETPTEDHVPVIVFVAQAPAAVHADREILKR